MPAIRTARPKQGTRRQQGGVMLLEALIAILIFSIGILGVVGMQATAVKQSTDARYRAEAAHLANQLIGTMWTSNRALNPLQTRFNTCDTAATCAGYQEWLEKVAETLPGVEPSSPTEPTVNVDADGIVTISIFWRAPGDPEDEAPHRYDVQAQIGQ